MTALTRRTFFARAQAALATLAAPAVLTRAATAAPQDEGEDYYAKLGVPTIINAAGTYTYLTAAIMPPPVRAAVARAALHPVRLKDLQLASGAYLAKKLRCEAALVSSGASAALTLATAACVAKANNFHAEDIPARVIACNNPAAKNEIIVQKAHRYEYDHAMQLCGVAIREVVTPDDFKRTVSDKTVMSNFFNSAESTPIGREEWIRLCHDHNVPAHNDAAADMPPIENLWKLTGMGFDLVCFSGGKGIRGPQNAGLLLGRKDLIDLAAANDSPIDQGVGRGMKVAKEQIVGMVAAVDWLLTQTDATMLAGWNQQIATIRAALQNIPTLTTTVFTPEVANHVPHLLIRYDPARLGLTPIDVAKTLRAGTPSIELNPATGTGNRGFHADPNTIILATWMLQPGEDSIVATRLRAALLSKQT